ncbi:MAG: hypothetical protein NC033_00465 [Clostridiales bacterium]|nr:hypothetical protein [Clostridiales bacterium]
MAGTISQERLKTVLDESLLGVTLALGDGKIEINPKIYFSLTGGMCAKGYTITAEGESVELENFEALVKRLADSGAKGNFYSLVKISDDYNSVEQFDEYLKLENITMEDLLAKYPQADEFELVIPDYEGALTDEQAENMYGEISEVMRRQSLKQYERISEEERAQLPDFDTLYGEIEEECGRFRKEHAETVEKNNGLAFFCDQFNRGNTKYKAPSELWHIYHNIDFVQCCLWQNQYKSEKECHPLAGEIENNPALNDALLSVKITYSWHCTTSGASAKVFRFKLTAGAKAWLLTHKDDYDIVRDGFEDLALYSGGELIFSSCTHEHFHVTF